MPNAVVDAGIFASVTQMPEESGVLTVEGWADKIVSCGRFGRYG